MRHCILFLLILFLFAQVAIGADGRISEETETCIGCHESITPGIVADWKGSHHAKVTPAEGLKKAGLEKTVSATRVPENLINKVVGCAECHTINPGKHSHT